MTFFTTNHSEAKDPFEPVKPGKYEAVITETEVKQASSGNMMIRTVYTIRQDVDQPFGKRKIFDNLVASDNEFCIKKFQQMAKAIGLPEGYTVPSIEDFAKLMMYKAVRITVTNKNDTYQGETRVKEEVRFIDEPGVPYSGDGGQAANTFDVPGGSEFPADDFPAEENDAGDVPPWEQPADPEPEKPKSSRKKKDQPADPFADDGKPFVITDDDLPF